MTDKEIPVPAVVCIAIVVVALIVWGLMRVMTPHERIIHNSGEAQEFAAARARQQMQTGTNAQASPPNGGH